MTEQIKKTRAARRAKATTEDNSVVELPEPLKPATRKKSTKKIIQEAAMIDLSPAATAETEVDLGKSSKSAKQKQTTEALQETMQEKLQRLFESHFALALAGDSKSAEICIKVSSEIAKREGAYAATKTHTKIEGELKVEQSTQYDLSKVSFEDLQKMNALLEQAKVSE